MLGTRVGTANDRWMMSRPKRLSPRLYLRQRAGLWYIVWHDERPRSKATGLRDQAAAQLALEAFQRKREHDAGHQLDIPDAATIAPAAVIRVMWRRAYNRALLRRMRFELAQADVTAMMLRSGGRCAVTGIPFDYKRLDGHTKRPWAPSLDRIEASDGYTVANCRIVCVVANLAMNTWGEGVFRQMLEHYQALHPATPRLRGVA